MSPRGGSSQTFLGQLPRWGWAVVASGVFIFEKERQRFHWEFASGGVSLQVPNAGRWLPDVSRQKNDSILTRRNVDEKLKMIDQALCICGGEDMQQRHRN